MKAIEDEEFNQKEQVKCINDNESYKIKKERDAYWSQVQQLRAEVQRLEGLLRKKRGKKQKFNSC